MNPIGPLRPFIGFPLARRAAVADEGPVDDSTTTCHGAAVSEALTGPERLLALGVVLANLALIVGLTMRADFSNLQGNGAGPGTPPAEVVPADAPTTDPALFAHGGTPGAR